MFLRVAVIDRFYCTFTYCIKVCRTLQLLIFFVWLFILVQPEIDKSKELRKAASKTGVTGYLTCRAEGAPLVQFEWRKVNRIEKTKELRKAQTLLINKK